jgi:dihydrodipicolinate synthase/N-acetylneuraminate lyase
MLRGIVPAMITPSRDGNVALDVLETYTDWLVEQGVHGLFAVGTTGEGLLLHIEQWRAAVEAVTRSCRSRIPVVVQCGGISLQDTSWRVKKALAAGANGIALMSPYFYSYTDADVEAYFSAVLGAWMDVPFYLYNIPKYTKHVISPDLYSRLAARFHHLAGIKDSSGTVESLRAFIEAVPTRSVLSGSDATMKEAYEAGAAGIVSGIAAALPHHSLEAWRKLSDGDGQGAAHVKSIRDVFHQTSTIRAARAVLDAQGLPMGDSFSPLPSIESDARAQLYSELRSTGVFLPDHSDVRHAGETRG